MTPATGAALRFFATAIAARAVVEVGTGCGSSGIWLLRGMRPGGVLTSVDTEPEYHRLARKAFTQAGFAANQARLILGRALDVLPRLSDGAYDLVFCDADAAAYPEYLTAGLRLLRAGGIVVFNDALPPSAGPAEDGARELADMIRIDERLVPLLLPVAGGLLAAIKKRELSRTYAWFQFSGTILRRLLNGLRWHYPTAACSASPSLAASSADSSTTSLPPPSNGTRITMPRPSLVTSSGPSPVRGFIAAILHPLPYAPAYRTHQWSSLSGARDPSRAAGAGRLARRTQPAPAQSGPGQQQPCRSVALLSRVRTQNGNDRLRVAYRKPVPSALLTASGALFCALQRRPTLPRAGARSPGTPPAGVAPHVLQACTLHRFWVWRTSRDGNGGSWLGHGGTHPGRT